VTAESCWVVTIAVWVVWQKDEWLCSTDHKSVSQTLCSVIALHVMIYGFLHKNMAYGL